MNVLSITYIDDAFRSYVVLSKIPLTMGNIFYAEKMPVDFNEDSYHRYDEATDLETALMYIDYVPQEEIDYTNIKVLAELRKQVNETTQN